MKYRRRPTAAMLAVLCVGCLLGYATRAQEIWFAPPAAPALSRLHRAVDFMDLFEPDAPWQEAASHIRVFQLSGAYVSHAPQQEIDAVISGLNKRQIPLALVVGVINVGPRSTHPPCGGLGQVEGYGTDKLARVISEKVKRAGGAIRFIAMDEPLWFGHYFKGRPGGQPGCQSSVADILELIKSPLGVYAGEFPNVVVGDVEPTDIAEQRGWKEVMSAWTEDYRRQMGRPLAFEHLDIPFRRPGEEGFAVDFYRIAEHLKQESLIGAIGVIYNGTPAAANDESWIEDAKAHIRLMEDERGLHPDHAVIQSWDAYPQHVLPESSSSSLTGLVDFYAKRMRKRIK